MTACRIPLTDDDGDSQDGISLPEGVPLWRLTEMLSTHRERAAKMYARASYITAVGIVELPYLVAQTLVFVPVSYFMIGERPGCLHMPVLCPDPSLCPGLLLHDR